MEERNRRADKRKRSRMKKWMKIITAFALIFGMTALFRVPCKAEEGWTQENIDGEFVWKFYQNGKQKVLSWYHEPSTGYWFYFDEEGAMVTGWGTGYAEGYYFDDESGVMITGWNKLIPDETQEPVNTYSDREPSTNSTAVSPSNSVWYYFGDNGRMVTGWKKTDGNWYYFSDGFVSGFRKGELLTGFVNIENASYYFDEETGKMYTGMYIDADGERYYFSKSGIMKKEYWITEDKKRYYMGSDGRAYHASGRNEAMVTTIDDHIYAFDEDGVMLSSRTIYYVNGTWTLTKPTAGGEYSIYTLNVYGKGTAGSYNVQ